MKYLHRIAWLLLMVLALGVWFAIFCTIPIVITGGTIFLYLKCWQTKVFEVELDKFSEMFFTFLFVNYWEYLLSIKPE